MRGRPRPPSGGTVPWRALKAAFDSGGIAALKGVLKHSTSARRASLAHRRACQHEPWRRREAPFRNSALVTRLIVDIYCVPRCFAPGISRRLRATSATPPAHRFSPCRRLAPATAGPFRRSKGFTLLELLIVVGIIAVLFVLLAPAFTYIKGGTDVTSAAYTIKDVLDTARTYAKANNTYTWVGFFEEDTPSPPTSPATPGIGRVARLDRCVQRVARCSIPETWASP